MPETINLTKKETGKSLSRKIFSSDNFVGYAFLAPFLLLFIIFVLLPVFSALLLSFTDFNSIERPRFVGWDNFRIMFTQDLILMRYVIPNTFRFAVFVGPVGYFMTFMFAWLINQLPDRIRKYYSMALYTPSIAGGIMMSVVWVVFFSGDRLGYLNNLLITLGVINNPVDWTQDQNYLMGIMIFVTIWGSMGVGFLSLLAGIQNVDPQLYEAGKIDGVRNRLQMIWYITVPSTKPQMLFSAVMSIVGAIRAGSIGVQLSGMNPTPNYAGQLFQNHIEDYGFMRYELGYATALSLVLILVIITVNKFCFKLLEQKDGE